MSDDRSVYEVEISGLMHTFRLTKAEAEARGATPVKPVPEAKNKGRTPRNKKVDSAGAPAADAG